MKDDLRLQDVVYNSTYDEVLRQSVRSAKSPEDCCDLGELAAAIARMDEEIKEEVGADQPVEPLQSALDAQQAAAEENAKTKEHDFEESAASKMLKKIQVANVAKTGDVHTSDPDDIDKIKAAEKEVVRIFDANVTFSPIPDSEKKARTAIQGSAVGKLSGASSSTGGDTKFCCIFVDPALLGEPVTAPHLRINAIPQDKVKVGPRGRNPPLTRERRRGMFGFGGYG